MIPKINNFETSIFNLPFDGMLTFDKEQPQKLTAMFREKTCDIDLIQEIELINKNNLVPMFEKGGEVHLNVTAKDGQVYKVKMKKENFTKITLLFVEQLPPVRINHVISMIGLEALGLESKEYEILQKYYNECKPDLESAAKKRFIKRNESGLPRTIIYVPVGEFKGGYALLKTHGKIEEKGLGAFNLVTFALPMDIPPPLRPNQMKVFRSGRNTFQTGEANINELLLNAKNLYSVGLNFIYQGPYRSRRGTNKKRRELNKPKDYIPRQENIEKIGYLLDYLEGGTMQQLLERQQKFCFREAIVFNLKATYAIAELHETYSIVISDIKPGNIFLTNECDPVIGDFGFAKKIKELMTACGTPLYSSPESLKARLSGEAFTADPASDVWSLGLILWSTIGGIDFLNEWKKSFTINKEDEKALRFMSENVEKIKDDLLEIYSQKYPEALPLIIIIKKCLEADPRIRLKAIDVYNQLCIIYHDLIEKEKLLENLKDQSAITKKNL